MKRIKRATWLAALAVCLLSLVLSGCAEEQGEGTLVYTLSEDGSFYTVSSSGARGEEELLIRAEYDGLPVREIADGAFRGHKNLRVIRFEEDSPLSVIGRAAFEDCSSLTEVELPGEIRVIGDDAFLGCRSLARISFPDGVVEIGYGSFSYCKALTEVVIPDSVERIGAQAFYSCDGLESITLPFTGQARNDEKNLHFGYIFGAPEAARNNDFVPSSLQTVTVTDLSELPQAAFLGCSRIERVILSEKTERIGARALANCTSLEETVLPSTLEEIGEKAFAGCSSLLEVEIPSRVETLGASAFEGCKLLYRVAIAPEGELREIGDAAFRDCYSLLSVTLPKHLGVIGKDAFLECGRLVEVYDLSDKIEITDHDEWENGYLGRYAWHVYKNLETESRILETEDGFFFYDMGYTYGLIFYKGDAENLVLPKDVDGKAYEIHSTAFALRTDLVSVTYPEGCLLRSVGSSAFAYCTSLKKVSLPATVTGIDSSAFQNCTALTEIEFGKDSALRVISTSVFSGCTALKELTLPKSLAGIGKGAFNGCRLLESVTFEKSEGWWATSDSDGKQGPKVSDLNDPEKAAKALKETYVSYYLLSVQPE